MVKSKYFPRSGTVNEVGGIISANKRKNTVNDSRIEMHNDTCNKPTKCHQLLNGRVLVVHLVHEKLIILKLRREIT